MSSPGYEFLWRSGQLVVSADATVHVRSVGHASVSAVFEGINAYWSDELTQLQVFRLHEHLRRLIDSTKLAHLAVGYSMVDLEAAVLDLLRKNDVRADVHIRPWSFAAGNPIEQMVPENAACETVIDSWPFQSKLSQGHVCTAAITSWSRISGNALPPRMKAFANYHNGRLGNIDARHRGADWPIFLNEHGYVTESSGATIGLFKNGVFYTPGLEAGILQGVTRDTVMQLLRDDLGIPVVERNLDRSELYLADEVVFIGTSAEVMTIGAIDRCKVGDGGVGPLTAALQDEYLAVLRGQRPKRGEWLTPVWSKGSMTERTGEQ